MALNAAERQQLSQMALELRSAIRTLTQTRYFAQRDLEKVKARLKELQKVVDACSRRIKEMKGSDLVKIEEWRRIQDLHQASRDSVTECQAEAFLRVRAIEAYQQKTDQHQRDLEVLDRKLEETAEVIVLRPER